MFHSPQQKFPRSLLLLFLSLNWSCINAQGEPKLTPRITPEESEAAAQLQTEKIFFSQEQFISPLKLPPEIIESLRQQKYLEALKQLEEMGTSEFSEIELQAYNIQKAWLAILSDTPEKAIPFLQLIKENTTLPTDYKQFLLGGICAAQKKNDDAIKEWSQISNDSPLALRAQWRMIALQKDDDMEKYWSGITKLANQEFPIPNGEEILWTLSQKEGFTTKTGYPYLRKLWAHYPYGKHNKEVSGYLSEFKKISDYQPTVDDWNIRAKNMMTAWQFKPLISQLASFVQKLQPDSTENCELLYAYGRAHFKINSVTKASQLLKPVGEKCVGINDDVGAKAYYLMGKSFERKKMWAEAAKSFVQIPEKYPKHSMADDGYALAGIGWQESGNAEKATEMWIKQVKTFPDGDLIGEGYWRLAWNAFTAGDTDKAIEWSVEAQKVVPPYGSFYQYFAFPYWEARWRIWPSFTDATQKTENTNELEKGLTGFKNLISNHPTEFYALLASARLYELDSEWITQQKRVTPKKEDGWFLTTEMGGDPVYERAQQLLKSGLLWEADQELHNLSETNIQTKAIHNFVHREINWYEAHDDLHKYSQRYPPHTWQDNQGMLFSQIYPNTHWTTLQDVGKDHQYDLRIFHALVREESSFNPEIVSWAGAKGLSQLMPATADRVASWVGITVNSQNIFDPKTNLTIGSRYLEYLRGYFNGNMFLAVAGYNAGEGNVNKWLSSKGNLPTDAFIESIPFRETRHYVKRVFGTYQAYHYLKDDSATFIDYSPFNHQAKP